MSLFGNKEWSEFSFEERLAVKIAAESSFLNFARIFFEITQGEPLIINWHHRWFAEEADKRIRGEDNSSLAIAVPPGSTKTEFFSIFIHAYTLALIRSGQLKRFRNLSLSSGKALVERNSKRVRDIVNSPEFQELWPCSFSVSQAEEWVVNDDKGRAIGTMVSKPMGGQIIGSRGGYPGKSYSGAIILDDPDKADDLFSAVKRERAHRLLTNTVRSRRGDKSKSHPTPVFIIQQRLHKEDSLGYCLTGGMGIEFKSVVIPALITDDFVESLPEHIKQDCLKDTKDSPRVKRAGVEYFSFWEQMEGVEQLVELWDRDEYTFMSQYQQAPISLSGNLVDTSWFPRYDTLPPDIVGGAVYVDTNSGMVNERNDYTAFSLFFVTSKGDLYWACTSHGKWDPEELLKEAEDRWAEWKSAIPHTMNGLTLRYMSIEKKQAGQGLIQTLTKKKKIPLHPQERGTNQNKYARHCNTYPTMKGGKVFIPKTFDANGNAITHTKWINGDKAYSTDWVTAALSELESITIGILMDQESGYDDIYDTLMDGVQDLVIDQGDTLSTALSARRKRRK